MAKRKRSTALFEVISKSKQYRPGRPATARSGDWLKHATSFFSRPKFKPLVPAPKLIFGRGALAAQEMDYEEAPAAPSAQEAAFAEPIQNDLPEELPTYQPTAAPLIIAYREPPPPKPVEPERVIEVREPKGDPFWKKWKFESKFSYGTGMAAGMALLLVVGVAAVATRHWNHASTPLLAQVTSDELRKGPAHPEVLDPLPTRRSTAQQRPVEAKTPPRTVPVTETHASQLPPAQPPAEGTRYLGRNYVMIQSYPDSETEMAEKAAAFLNARGVACTVEHDVKGFLKVSVVGLEGFEKISSPDFKAYVDHIKKLSADYSNSATKSFKAFDPRPKKWDKQD